MSEWKRMMRKKFRMIKLASKFTALILGVLMIPIGIFLLLFFHNMNISLNDNGKTRITYELEKSAQNAEQIAVNCHLSTQMIVNNESMNDFLNQIHSNKEFSFMDILDFYGKEISGVQKVVRSNPYIYKMRIFVNSDTAKETMPLLYKKERIKELKWGKNGVPATGTWCIDYEDMLDQTAASDEKPRIASLITRLNDYRYGQYGVIEAAVTMEDMFPDLYHSTEIDWTCYIDRDGNFYYDQKKTGKWKSYTEEIRAFIQNNPDKESIQNGGSICINMQIGGEEVLIGCQGIKSLNGYLFRIVSLKSDRQLLKLYNVLFFLLWTVIAAALLLFANKLVAHILKQFYEIYEVVYRVQQGDMEVRVKKMSQDEFGVLGKEINTMLDRIRKLMDETLRRELIVKDSQIKALQNQINTHFIYNVLESVKMMAEIDEKYEIADTVSSFGKLLRYSMRWTSQYVTVEEEIGYIKNYLALANLWFDYEIYLNLQMPQDIMLQEIPKMSLQPVIENAINHGIREIDGDTGIYMEGEIKGSYCCIKITDMGRGMSAEEVDRLQKRICGEAEDTSGSGNGIGLKNVQDRLQIGFGPEYGVAVESKEGEYTQVTVKIPYLKRKKG